MATTVCPAGRCSLSVIRSSFVSLPSPLITMQSPTPDILMAGLLYLAVGLLLRLWARPQGFSLFVALGAGPGFGYLAKAAVFPLAFLFFAISWGLSGGWRRAIPRVLVALVAFFAVSGPWIAALSHAAGHLTFGDTGRSDYVREVNHASPNPYFQNPGTAWRAPGAPGAEALRQPARSMNLPLL